MARFLRRHYKPQQGLARGAGAAVFDRQQGARMTRVSRTRRAVAAAAFIGILLSAAAVAGARPPNILLIVADDMGFADVGVHGCRDIPTPNLDSIARDGVRC